ncbi:hypothetical protein ACKKBG_A27210 [Auxenochlorella protothecoides x Auxenochlorella symbiontica]
MNAYSMGAAWIYTGSNGAVLFTVSTDYTTNPVVWDSVLPASTAALASYAQAVALSYIGLSTNALTLHWELRTAWCGNEIEAGTQYALR